MGREKIVVIAPHAYKHGLSEQQILSAWESIVKHAIATREDGTCDIVGIGLSHDGKEIQLIARARDYGIIIFHALAPPQNKVRKLIEDSTEVYHD